MKNNVTMFACFCFRDVRFMFTPRVFVVMNYCLVASVVLLFIGM